MTEQREIIFLDELEKQLERTDKEVLSLGISGTIEIYSVIESSCTGFVYGRGPTDEGHSHEGQFRCTYRLNRAELISLRTSTDSKVSVSFRYERNFDPTGESIETNSIFDLQTDFDGWDYLVGDGEISMSSLFSHDDEKLRSVSCKEENTSPLTHIKALPQELQLAISVFYEFWHEKPGEMNPAKNEAVAKFLKLKAGKEITGEKLKRISTIARPEKARKGGAHRSEVEHYKGKSQEK